MTKILGEKNIVSEITTKAEVGDFLYEVVYKTKNSNLLGFNCTLFKNGENIGYVYTNNNYINYNILKEESLLEIEDVVKEILVEIKTELDTEVGEE